MSEPGAGATRALRQAHERHQRRRSTGVAALSTAAVVGLLVWLVPQTSGWESVQQSFFSPDAFDETWGEHLEAGFAKGGRTRADLEVSPSIQVAIDGDLEAARAVVRAGLLLYLGGMGSRETNFYVDLTHRFGFGQVADEVQSLYLDGKRDEAYNAIPDELVAATSLIGSEAEVAEQLDSFGKIGVDRLICSPVQLDREQRLHTVGRLAALAGAPAPA